MLISLWVYFYDMPGGALERRVQELAVVYSGMWTGQGTDVVSGERDNSFVFQDEESVRAFRDALTKERIDIIRIARKDRGADDNKTE